MLFTLLGMCHYCFVMFDNHGLCFSKYVPLLISYIEVTKQIIAVSTTMHVNNTKGMQVLAVLSTTIHKLTENEAVQRAF